MKIRKRLIIILLKSSNGLRTPLLNNTMTRTINHQMLLSHPIIRRQLHCWCRWWPTPLNFALWLQLASTWPWPENMQSVAKLPECVSYPFSEMKWKKRPPQIYLKNVEGATRKHIFLLNNVECRCVNEKDSSKRIITYCDDDNLRRMLKVVVRKEKRKNISEKNRCDDARSCWSWRISRSEAIAELLLGWWWSSSSSSCVVYSKRDALQLHLLQIKLDFDERLFWDRSWVECKISERLVWFFIFADDQELSCFAVCVVSFAVIHSSFHQKLVQQFADTQRESACVCWDTDTQRNRQIQPEACFFSIFTSRCLADGTKRERGINLSLLERREELTTGLECL